MRPFAELLADAAAAWRTADMARTCRLSYGELPASAATEVNAVDLVAQTWDIATAAAIPLLGADEHVWVAALNAAQNLIGPAESRDSAHYAPSAPTLGRGLAG